MRACVCACACGYVCAYACAYACVMTYRLDSYFNRMCWESLCRIYIGSPSLIACPYISHRSRSLHDAARISHRSRSLRAYVRAHISHRSRSLHDAARGYVCAYACAYACVMTYRLDSYFNRMCWESLCRIYIGSPSLIACPYISRISHRSRSLTVIALCMMLHVSLTVLALCMMLHVSLTVLALCMMLHVSLWRGWYFT